MHFYFSLICAKNLPQIRYNAEKIDVIWRNTIDLPAAAGKQMLRSAARPFPFGRAAERMAR